MQIWLPEADRTSLNAQKMLESGSEWENPYGNGNAAELTLQSMATDYSTEYSNIEDPEQIHY